jgi:hypothetical protein
MRFILVNGRSLRRESRCVMCAQPIGANYLREIGTHLTYCNHTCYADHCQSAFLLLEGQQEPRETALPTVRYTQAQQRIIDALC